MLWYNWNTQFHSKLMNFHSKRMKAHNFIQNDWNCKNFHFGTRIAGFSANSAFLFLVSPVDFPIPIRLSTKWGPSGSDKEINTERKDTKILWTDYLLVPPCLTMDHVESHEDHRHVSPCATNGYARNSAPRAPVRLIFTAMCRNFRGEAESGLRSSQKHDFWQFFI